jgi:hypothetical protein
MPSLTGETRNRLVELIRSLPDELAPGTIPVELLNDAREALRVAFEELGYSGEFYLSKKPGTSGTSNFSEEATWLLTEGRKRGPDDVVNSLEGLVLKNEACMRRIGAIWGLHPDRPIRLSGELTLYPLSDISPSSARDSLLSTLDPSLNPLARNPSPRAAIVREFVHRPLFFRRDEPQASFTWEDKHFISDVASLLVLLNDSPVVRIAEWYETDSQVPILGAGLGWSGGFSELNTAGEIPVQTYDAELAEQLVNGFLSLSPSDKRRLITALRRLNLASLRGTQSDVALEIGLTLETLLTERGDPQDSITYRLRIRAALLLGGTIDEREATASQVSRLYGLRSYVAHGGDLDGHSRGSDKIEVSGNKYTASDLSDTLTRGKQLCGRIAREILRIGSFPSYNRMTLGVMPIGAE